MELSGNLLGLFIAALILGLIGAAIGQTRGRVEAGFVWGFLLGPLGWLIVLLGPNPKKEKEEAERRNHERRLEAIEERHLEELRALRESMSGKGALIREIAEDSYWVRLGEKEVGPFDKLQIIELMSSGKISRNTMVAPDDGSGSLVYRPLMEVIPGLKHLTPKSYG